MPKIFAVLIVLAVVANPAVSMADPSISSNSGQRYITVQTYWSDMSEAARKAVVTEAVTQVRNEIAQKAPILKNPTLTDSLLTTEFMSTLTTELTRYLDGISRLEGSKYALLRKATVALPRALLITIGGSAGFHWVLGAKASMDIGLVLMFPSFSTVIDTAKRDTDNQPLVIEDDKLHLFDTAIVGVPHAYAGLGAGGGGTFSIGISGIWGSMSSASDFYGAIVAASAGFEIPLPQFIPFPDGADLDIGIVANVHKVFVVASLAADKGAEAAATFDGDAGAVVPWQTLVAPVSDTQAMLGWVFPKKHSDDSGDDQGKHGDRGSTDSSSH